MDRTVEDINLLPKENLNIVSSMCKNLSDY